MRKRKKFNRKRKVQLNCDSLSLNELAKKVKYIGNPEHKRNPGDFGLTPPSQPRADKTLCDEVDIKSKANAQKLLIKGVRQGLISEQTRGNYPQIIWAVIDEDTPVEAQLDNSIQGTYHGYPMPTTDPFRDEVLTRWKES